MTKKMTTKELKNKSEKELHTLLKEKALALKNFRFAVAGSNVRNVKEGNVFRKDIARIKTLLNNPAVK
jgi:ribosomal protein L29